MKRTKGLVISVTLALVLVVSACIVWAYGNQVSGTIDDVTYQFSNYISADQKSASATTWLSSPSTDASVSVTFYWYIPGTTSQGSYTLGNGNYGEITVYAPTLPSSNMKYYKVVSNHIAGYHGINISYPGLTTDLSK